MYSWQNQLWQQIMQRKQMLPHAMLFRGRRGLGKQAFAMDLSQTLLCSQPTHEQQACGICPSCIWFKEGNHPDFRFISPEDDDINNDESVKKKSVKKTQISVQQIRQLFGYLSLSNHQADSLRIIVISPAETLNLASANALLKMLEEPPQNTLFLLVTGQPQRLLPTIISRCQAIDMPMPNQQQALDWLRETGISNPESALDYAGGSPLIALENDINEPLIKQLALGAKLDPFINAPLFLALGMERAIEVLQKWVFDLLSFRLTNTFHYHTAYANAFQNLVKSVNLSQLLAFQQSLVEAKKTANHPLSNEMQLEHILLSYAAVFNLRG